MNLFIPRKTNLVGGATTVDAQHLEKVLMDNFLAIERWANQQSVSCCIAQTSTHTMTSPYGQAVGPWTMLWDQYQLADTANNRIRIPESGIYVGFASVQITPAQAALFLGGGGALGWISAAVSGGSSFMTPSFFEARDSGVTSLTTSSISFVGPGELLASFPFSASTAGYLTLSVNSNSTGISEQASAWGFVRINNIPSKTQ